MEQNETITGIKEEVQVNKMAVRSRNETSRSTRSGRPLLLRGKSCSHQVYNKELRLQGEEIALVFYPATFEHSQQFYSRFTAVDDSEGQHSLGILRQF